MRGRMPLEPSVSPRFMTQGDEPQPVRTTTQHRSILKCGSNRSLVRAATKTNRQSQDSTQNRHRSESVFVTLQTDKENEQPNCESNLLESRSFSQIDNFRKQRFRKLYGEGQSNVQQSKQQEVSISVLSKVFQEKESVIMEQQCTIRRLEQQLRQKDRLMMQMQKNLAGKESHIASLTNAALSHSSAMELLKHQLAHLTLTNLNMQNETTKLRPQVSLKDREIGKLRQELHEKLNELSTFSGLELRLKELQELQDTLIEEAATLRQQNRCLTGFVNTARQALPTSQQSCSICSSLFRSLRNLYE